MELADIYDEQVIERGESYLDRVKKCIKVRDIIHAEVQGRHIYTTKVHLDTLKGECSCPYQHNCKHSVAAYLYYKENKKAADAGAFTSSLKKMEKKELIKILIDNLQYMPNVVLKHQFEKKGTADSFVETFISDFSYAKLEKVSTIAQSLSFKQLIRILAFLSENEDKVFDKIYEDYGVADEGEVLYDVVEDLRETMVKKITSEKELLEALKDTHVKDYIFYYTERFARFKTALQTHLTKEDYLRFLLRLKNPNLKEIKQYLEPASRKELLYLPLYNLPLAERLGNELKDRMLLFVTALKKKDVKTVLAHFDAVEYSRKLNYPLQAGEIVSLLKEAKVKDEKYARALFQKDFIWRYTENNLAYLIPLIADYAAIAKEFDLSGDFSKQGIFLERLVELDKKKAQKIFENPSLLTGKHWTTVMKLLTLAEEAYGKEFMLRLIRRNKSIFKTSSTLKSALKKKRIIVTASKEGYEVRMG